MRVTKLHTLAITTALLYPAMASSRGHSNWDAPRIVTTNCSGCHGIDGNAEPSYFPKLAGLDAVYAEKKLAAFSEPAPPPVDEAIAWTLRITGLKKNGSGDATHEERVNMEGESHAAGPGIMKEAVAWYARQPPAHGHAGNKALIEQGKNLFLNGVTAEKVLACASCHGPDASGKGLAPRIAGQNAEYIRSQLAKFRKGDRRHAPEMTLVTRDLDVEQARAVAAYLQSR